MGLGNYLGQRSERLYAEGQRDKESWEIDHFPEIETQEIRDIFKKWGFTGDLLEQSVTTVIANRGVWIDMMMKHELEIQESEEQHPARKGLATFVAFVIAGTVPLVPFLFAVSNPLSWSIGMTIVELFTIGALRAKLTPIRWYSAGLEMLTIGAVAAGSAYAIGALLQKVL